MPGEREPSGKLAGKRGRLGRLEVSGASGPLSGRKDSRRPAGKGVFSLLSAAVEKASGQLGIQAGGSLFLIQSEER